MFLQIICILFLIPAALAAFYYAFLAIYALLSRKENLITEKEPEHTFAIVIPAHNEAQNILDTLESCAAVDYPKEKYKVFVIADNCSDRTAEIASKNGATVLERFDEEKKGKGFALEWGFKEILKQGWEALVVLDADCVLDTRSLRVFDACLTNGEKVLQINNVASNPDSSATSYVVAVGNLIENRLFYAPKSKLGLAVFLRGTGMVFKREVLEQYPWQSHSVVEDVEYSLCLIKNGAKVRFLPEVTVSSPFPVNSDQLDVQRIRWAGNLGFSKRKAVQLMWAGIVNRRGLLIDAGWTLLTLSRPLVLLELFLTLILIFLYIQVQPGPLSNAFMVAGLIIVLIQGLYFGTGILLLGVTVRRISFLLTSPVTIGKLVLLSLLGILGVRENIWARTPR